jgi:electron transfer flavoprotein beta subunit
MKAKKKPIKEIALDSLAVNLDKKVEILKTKAPEARKGGIKVASVDELIDKLRNEAKVI